MWHQNDLMDLGVDRKLQITERVDLKFRAEMFNLANTPHHSIAAVSS